MIPTRLSLEHVNSPYFLLLHSIILDSNPPQLTSDNEMGASPSPKNELVLKTGSEMIDASLNKTMSWYLSYLIVLVQVLYRQHKHQ